MLTGLPTGVRLQVAILVAALAVSSFVVPPIALAFASGMTTAVYCLDEQGNQHIYWLEGSVANGLWLCG